MESSCSQPLLGIKRMTQSTEISISLLLNCLEFKWNKNVVPRCCYSKGIIFWHPNSFPSQAQSSLTSVMVLGVNLASRPAWKVAQQSSNVNTRAGKQKLGLLRWTATVWLPTLNEQYPTRCSSIYRLKQVSSLEEGMGYTALGTNSIGKILQKCRSWHRGPSHAGFCAPQIEIKIPRRLG